MKLYSLFLKGGFKLSNKCLPQESTGKYVESVFFQKLVLAGASGNIVFENPREGMIIGIKYYFDSSQDETVESKIELKTRNNQGSLIYFPNSGGNTSFKGTNTTCKVEFKTEMQISYNDKIILTYNNASASSVTIMAVVNIRYRMGV